MADSNYFNGVFSLDNIPSQNLVKIAKKSGGLVVSVPLIYDDNLSIKAKSTFGDIYSPKSNALMSLLSNLTNGIVPSGQFALQNVQIWQKTDALGLSFSVKVLMNDSGLQDVVLPIKKLMKLCLPNIRKNNALSSKLGLLIPPGPSVTEILEITKSEDDSLQSIQTEEDSLVNIYVGKFQFTNCIITEVSPEFSSTVDSDGYPISAEVSIEAITCMVATKDMIDDIV